MTPTIPLWQRVKDAGIAYSANAARILIRAGQIAVDGKIVTSETFPTPDDAAVQKLDRAA